MDHPDNKEFNSTLESLSDGILTILGYPTKGKWIATHALLFKESDEFHYEVEYMGEWRLMVRTIDDFENIFARGRGVRSEDMVLDVNLTHQENVDLYLLNKL